MNETFNNILNRRSIRKYKPVQIKESELQQLVKAGIHSPNGDNKQNWHFTVIQNEKLINKLSDIIKLNDSEDDPEFHVFYHAPTIILISIDEDAVSGDVTCGAVAENIALAAESLGIGSCLITYSNYLYTPENTGNLKKELQIPENYKHACTVAIGYKDENPEIPERSLEVVSYIR